MLNLHSRYRIKYILVTFLHAVGLGLYMLAPLCTTAM